MYSIIDFKYLIFLRNIVLLHFYLFNYFKISYFYCFIKDLKLILKWVVPKVKKEKLKDSN